MKERIWFIVNPISGGRKKASLPALIVAHLDIIDLIMKSLKRNLKVML